ncbi:phage holin family protein [Streptomyces sp. NPDC049097]|uniref:phage holin family protein n=1 Tax=Streptomyces sp. NPDC049097 TaxID=3155497 RepID=UPI00344A7A0F
MGMQGDGSSDHRSPVGDAAARLAQDTAQLARNELLAVESEIRAALRRIGAGGALSGAAGVCGVLALWSAHETLLRSLEPILPGARASAVLGGAYAMGALALAQAARRRLCAVPGRAADAHDQTDKSAARTEPGPAHRGDGPA